MVFFFGNITTFRVNNPLVTCMRLLGVSTAENSRCLFTLGAFVYTRGRHGNAPGTVPN